MSRVLWRQPLRENCPSIFVATACKSTGDSVIALPDFRSRSWSSIRRMPVTVSWMHCWAVKRLFRLGEAACPVQIQSERLQRRALHYSGCC